MPPKNRLIRSNSPADGQITLRVEADAQPDHAHQIKIPERSAKQLLHELEVHQIELETQNETLRQSQIALEESRDRYIDFYDFAPTGYITLSRDALITEINLTGAAQLGMDRSKLVNRRFAPFVAPEDGDHWHRFFLSVLNSTNKLTCELTLLRVGETSFYAQLDCLCLNKEGNAPQIRIVLTDITQRWQTEESLRISSEEMKDIYNHAPCGYHSLDKDGTIRRINDTELAWLGYTRDELVGRVNWLDLVTPASRQIFRDNFPQFLKQGFVHDLEFEIIRKDGTTFTGLVNATAIYDHNGDYFISRSTVVDITARKKTEDMLRFHSEILKNVSEGIILIRSSNGEIVYANPRFERMFGYARDELLGKHVSVINAPSNLSPEAIAKEISDELNKNWRWSGEVHNIRKDRKTFWCHASVSTYTHPEYGRVWVAVHEDITQHRQLEDDLRESEKCRHLLEYQEIVQTSLDGFWIVDTSKGRILEVNDKYCNMVGYSKEEILSMTIQDLEAIETPEEIEARLNRILEVGYDRFETRHRHKQGHMVDFEVSVTHSKANGGRNLAFFREITERNRMLEALTKSEANYRILFRNSRDAMLTAMAVPPLQFTSANHSAMLMFGAKNEDELIGFRPWELSPERQPDGLKSSVKARQMIEIAVQNGSHFFEWVHKRLNGKTFPAEILLTRLAQDGANYIQATIRDISERKKTEREMLGHRNEMEQIQKMYVAAQTASAIAHEINQPLLAITSYSEAALMMMKSRKPDYDEICNAIEKSEQQALRAGRAIRDLIEFLNINDFAVEPFDFNKEIINVVGVAKSEHNLAFHSVLMLEEELPLVQANRTHTQKVLLNLIHNGIDATQAAGVPLPVITVTVCTTKDKKFAQMTIRDNGPGIKKEDVNRLFEPFFTTKAKGIGMGLAISRSLIEENGGQLWFDPQEGSGATFHLTLPLAI